MLMLERAPSAGRHWLQLLAVFGLTAAASLVTCVTCVPTARADTAIAGDLEALVPIDIDNVEVGPGFGFRLGQQLHLPLITLTPEIGFHYASFADGPKLYRGTLGARLGVGELLRVGVDAHFGLGYQKFETPASDYSHSGLTIDAGLFLDFTLLPLLDLGLHAGYGRLAGDEESGAEPFQWVTFGVHAALII